MVWVCAAHLDDPCSGAAGWACKVGHFFTKCVISIQTEAKFS